MAVAPVQRTSASSASDTNPMTLTLNGVANGNTLVISFAYYSTNQPAPTVSDSAGNTYTEVGTGSSSIFVAVHCFVAKNVTGGNITATVTKYNAVATAVTVEFLELSGADKTTPVDNHSQNSANSASANAGTVTVSGSGEYVLAIFGNASFTDATVTAGAGYTVETYFNSSGGLKVPYATEDITPVSTNQTPSLTYSASVSYCAMAVSFKAAPPASSSSSSIKAGAGGGTPIFRSAIIIGAM